MQVSYNNNVIRAHQLSGNPNRECALLTKISWHTVREVCKQVMRILCF